MFLAGHALASFIKQSGGHIEIIANSAKARQFGSTLPRLCERPPVIQENAPVVQPPPLGGQETILAVKDNDEVRAYTTDILRELGYEVLEATEGDTALSLIASEPRIELYLQMSVYLGHSMADK